MWIRRTDTCNTIILVACAKKTISRDRRKNYPQCWDAAYERLYYSLINSPNGSTTASAAATLLERIDHLPEAGCSIGFSHSRRKARDTCNNFTERYSRSTKYSPFVQIPSHQSLWLKIGDRAFNRVVGRETSKVWKNNGITFPSLSPCKSSQMQPSICSVENCCSRPHLS